MSFTASCHISVVSSKVNLNHYSQHKLLKVIFGIVECAIHRNLLPSKRWPDLLLISAIFQNSHHVTWLARQSSENPTMSQFVQGWRLADTPQFTYTQLWNLNGFLGLSFTCHPTPRYPPRLSQWTRHRTFLCLRFRPTSLSCRSNNSRAFSLNPIICFLLRAGPPVSRLLATLYDWFNVLRLFSL